METQNWIVSYREGRKRYQLIVAGPTRAEALARATEVAKDIGQPFDPRTATMDTTGLDSFEGGAA
jgi:hypothetical protein